MAGVLEVLRYLFRLSRGVPGAAVTLVAVSVLGALAGLASPLMIALVNRRLHAEALPHAVLLFAGVCLLQALSRFAAGTLLVLAVQKSVFALRLRLADRILAAPLRRIEEIGTARLLASMTEDVSALTQALGQLPVLVMELAVIAGCWIYFFSLSWRVALTISAIVLVGGLLYQWPMRLAHGHFAAFRREWDALFEGLRGLTQGLKELKQNSARREDFLREELVGPLSRLQRSGLLGNAFANAAGSWAQLVFFFALGWVVFAWLEPGEAAGPQASAFALTLLFVGVPLEVVLNLLPQFARAQVSAGRIDELVREVEPEPTSPAGEAPPGFRVLRLEGVVHTYREAGGVEFTLGPLDLELTAGEIVFIVGGNGSGKTTLLKLLTGLYLPEAGTIRWDGQPVDAGNRERFRGLFATVFSDFHLFRSLHGISDDDAARGGQAFLERVGLAERVQLEGRRLTSLELSQGQRRRLALVVSCLEDRPIYVFDEWAADQDPRFRNAFYREILPELRARGKTVVAITHDEEYFSTADRVIRLHRGQTG